jgi:hypothetical protein
MFVLFAASTDTSKIGTEFVGSPPWDFSTAKTKKSEIIITAGLHLFWSEGRQEAI